MGVHEQFYARQRRPMEFKGAGIGSFLKGAAKKGWQFIKNEGKTAGSSLFRSGKDYVKNELSSAGKEFANKTGNKLLTGVKDVIKESAGPLAESILKNPEATREVLSDHYKNASQKTKNLIKEAVEDSKDFAKGQAGEIKNRANISISEALAKSSKKKMKGKGTPKHSTETPDAIASKQTTVKDIEPHRRKRLTTIVPVAMPMQGNGALVIGSNHRGRGARVIGS